MRALLDMDGVVADFVIGAMELHEKPWPYDTVCGDEGWNLDRVWGMTPSEFWEGMGYDFWRGLPMTSDAVAIVELLRLMIGTDICFITSPCRNGGCMDGKRDWAKKYFPDIPILFSSTSCQRGAVPPKWFCAGADTILVDDSNINVSNFRKGGGKAVLVPRPWNHLYPLSTNSVLAVKMTLSALSGRN